MQALVPRRLFKVQSQAAGVPRFKEAAAAHMSLDEFKKLISKPESYLQMTNPEMQCFWHEQRDVTETFHQPL